MSDAFLALAEAFAPAPTPPPVPSSPPAISRPADKPTIPPAIPPVGPQKYRMADLYGQQFEHEDLGFLRDWITSRNAALMAPQRHQTAPQVLYFQQPSARVCGPTGCR